MIIIIAYLCVVTLNVNMLAMVNSILDLIGSSNAVAMLTSSLFVLIITYWLFKCLGNRNMTSTKDKSILVTGCDTGFGHSIAWALSNRGYFVFAGCLLDTGVDEFNGNESFNGEAFKLDVTKDEDVALVVDLVTNRLEKRNEKGLYGLVNNAGVIAVGPIEWQSLATMQQVMDINLWGTVRMCKAFLHLIKPVEGRILNMSSLAGRMQFTHASSYSMSKYGVEAFSDGLRIEMRPWNVSVHLIEPGMHRTSLLDQQKLKSMWDNVWNEIPDAMRESYGVDYFKKGKSDMSELLVNIVASPNISNVSEAIANILMSSNTKSRYVIGWDAHLIWIWAARLPTSLSDAWLRLIAKLPTPAAMKK